MALFATTGQYEAWLRDRPSQQPRVSRPPLRAVPAAPPTLERLLQQIQSLAQKHGWAGQYTYNTDEDKGLHLILVRGTAILFAEVTLASEVLTASQQTWLARLTRTGQVEVATWTTDDLPAITARLSQGREVR